MKTIIYTDGACSGNPGKAGWGAVVLQGKSVRELGGFDKLSTNNRMEITAAIRGLEATEVADDITIYTDSQYLVNGITSWIFGWMKKDWKNTEGKDILNRDLWQELYTVAEDRNIKWKVIRGHSVTPGNNRADEIAVCYTKNLDANLYFGELKDYQIDLTEPDLVVANQSTDKDRKKAKAFSYLSYVDGILQRHSTWADCENRVKGQAGAKFRKALSASDEQTIIREWGIKKLD